MKDISLVMEIYCSHELNEEFACIYAYENSGVHCLQKKCQFMSYAEMEYFLSLSDDNGYIHNFAESKMFEYVLPSELVNKENIDILKSEWAQICKRNIKEVK